MRDQLIHHSCIHHYRNEAIQIETLVPDIYELLKRKDGWFDEALSKDFSQEVSTRLHQQLGTQRTTNTLRLSQMGPRCPRALWFSIHHPELGEPLPPWAEIKYSFGHIIEALAVSLAKAAGHEVTGEQDELVLDGIVGHRDCVIDGCVVDVKSSSSRGFIRFKDGSLAQNDTFGYLDQLDGYVVASHLDPLVTVKDRGYILAVDKQLGHMTLYEHIIRERSIRERINYYKEIVGSSKPPACECRTIPQGRSGNISLDTKASYSPYKHCCFPFLRTFLYSDGPVYLTKVVRVPDVKEITKYESVDKH
jgi:hypothetical protein